MSNVVRLQGRYSGRIWQFNEDEDDALQFLPHADQVLYLRGFRANMDFDTGRVGDRCAVSYRYFRELLEVHRRRGSTLPGVSPTRAMVRGCIDRLESAGLVRRVSGEAHKLGDSMIFFLPLAHLGKVREPEEPHRNDTGATTSAGPALAAVEGGKSDPEENGRNSRNQYTSINNSTNVESKNSDELFGSSSLGGGLSNCPHQEILELWKKHWPGKSQPNPQLWARSDGVKHLRARWREAAQIRHSQTGQRLYTDLASGLEWWDRWLEHLAKRCSYLHTQSWFEFRWLIKPTNFAKALEGKYEDG